jgi:ABC-type lipoprotein release transport system permease subunit
VPKAENLFLLKMALRNLLRRKGRTLILVIGLALSNALTIWILTFRHNAREVLTDRILGLKVGREQWTAPGFYDFDKKLLNSHQTFSVKSVLSKVPEHVPHVWRLFSVMLLASDDNALPVTLNGYDLASELKNSGLGTILSGRHTMPPRSIVLGKSMAQKLNVKPSDEVGVIGQAADGSIANDSFTVTRILDLGGGAFEESFAFIDRTEMQDLLVLPHDRAHVLVNFSKEDISPKMKKIAPRPVRIPWSKFLPDVAISSDFMDNFSRFYAFFFAVVTSIAMGNTLALSFLERQKEYRTLAVIGAPYVWLRKSMRLEILILALGALVLGNLLVTLVIIFFSIYPVNIGLLTSGKMLQMGGVVLDMYVHAKILLWPYVLCNGGFVITMALASLYPTRAVLKKCETA